MIHDHDHDDRAETTAHAAGVEITWVRAGLLEIPDGTDRMPDADSSRA